VVAVVYRWDCGVQDRGCLVLRASLWPAADAAGRMQGEVVNDGRKAHTQGAYARRIRKDAGAGWREHRRTPKLADGHISQVASGYGCGASCCRCRTAGMSTACCSLLPAACCLRAPWPLGRAAPESSPLTTRCRTKKSRVACARHMSNRQAGVSRNKGCILCVSCFRSAHAHAASQ
jgi:hypothetical protein